MNRCNLCEYDGGCSLCEDCDNEKNIKFREQGGISRDNANHVN